MPHSGRRWDREFSIEAVENASLSEDYHISDWELRILLASRDMVEYESLRVARAYQHGIVHLPDRGLITTHEYRS